MSRTPKWTGGRRSRGMRRQTTGLPYDVPTDSAAPIDNTQAHKVP